MAFVIAEKEIEVPKPSAGGFKIFYFIKRNASISSEEFNKLWFESHEKILKTSEALNNQLRRFVHNEIIAEGLASYFGSKETITYDGIAAMWFDSTVAFRMYESELAAIAKKKGDFIDQSRTFFLYVDDLIIYEKKDTK